MYTVNMWPKRFKFKISELTSKMIDNSQKRNDVCTSVDS